VSRPSEDVLWRTDNQELARVARNVATPYQAIIVERFDAVAVTAPGALPSYLDTYLAFPVKADERRLYHSR
jgi:hypothetical protein